MNSKLHSMKLRIKLNGIKPEIWRSVVVENSLTLHDLHNVIQAAMGWGNCHMYEFEVSGIKTITPLLRERSRGFERGRGLAK